MLTKGSGRDVTTSAVIRRRGKNVVKSAGRSLEVLELFRDAQRPLRLTDIAEALSLPQSSASMLIRSLINMGYLVRHEHNYAPSLRLTLLGAWLNDATFRQGTLTSMIGELSAITGDTVILGARNGLFVEVVSVVPGKRDTMYHTRPGEARPLTRALMGHMFLSAMDRQEAEGLVFRINAEQKRADRRVKFQTLVPILDRIRENGYGYTEGTLPGGANVAMLLPPGPFGDQLVIGNAGTVERIRPRRNVIVNVMSATFEKFLRGYR